MKAACPPYWKDEQYPKHWSERIKKKKEDTIDLNFKLGYQRGKKISYEHLQFFFPDTGCIGISS